MNRLPEKDHKIITLQALWPYIYSYVNFIHFPDIIIHHQVLMGVYLQRQAIADKCIDKLGTHKMGNKFYNAMCTQVNFLRCEKYPILLFKILSFAYFVLVIMNKYTPSWRFVGRDSKSLIIPFSSKTFFCHQLKLILITDDGLRNTIKYFRKSEWKITNTLFLRAAWSLKKLPRKEWILLTISITYISTLIFI